MTVIGYGWWIAVIHNRDALAPEAPPWHSFPSDMTIGIEMCVGSWC